MKWLIKMKKTISFFIVVLLIAVLFPSSISAKAITEYNDNLIVEPLDVRKLWIEMHPVPWDGPAHYYYNNGYWHGYLQKVGFQYDRTQSFSYYSGYLYPLNSPIPIPSRSFDYK